MLSSAAALFLASCVTTVEDDFRSFALPDDADVLTDTEFNMDRRNQPDMSVRSGNYRSERDDSPNERWFQRTIQHLDGSVDIDWADTTNCAGAAEAFEAANAIEVPQLVPPEGAAEFQSLWLSTYVEGTYYSLQTEAWFSGGHTARIVITGPTASPIGQWGVAMFAALETCWSHTVPEYSR